MLYNVILDGGVEGVDPEIQKFALYNLRMALNDDFQVRINVIFLALTLLSIP